jgi:hypothetical protein
MSSVAPAATSYFLTLARSVLPDDAFVILMKSGTPLVFTAPLTLQVYGFTGSQVPAELSPQARREEEFSIDCCISSYMGDDDLEARMEEAQAGWDLLSVAIGNDYTLGHIVRWAQMAEYSFIPSKDTSGKALGSVEFKVNCQQRIDSLT